MRKLNLHSVTKYIEQNIGTFHAKRISILNSLNLKEILQQKNPYLYKANQVLTADTIVRGIVDAHISSNEETIFGDWLRGLAVYISGIVYDGRKSGIPNIDLEFDDNGARYIITIESGPNWGNSSQITKMASDFRTAKKILWTSNSQLNVVAVNGCCYGKDSQPDKGDYFKYCGQRFWHFISGEVDLYTALIISLEHQAKERKDFLVAYSNMINKFTIEFGQTFCKPDGSIDWEKLVRYNSGLAN